MPHLPLMQWDFKDQLQATSRQVVTERHAGDDLLRLRRGAASACARSTERQNGTRKKERIYLGGFEIYREYDGDGAMATLERETLHVMDDKQRIALVETRTQGNDGAPASSSATSSATISARPSWSLTTAAMVISYEEYYPYGSTSYQGVRSARGRPETVPVYGQGA